MTIKRRMILIDGTDAPNGYSTNQNAANGSVLFWDADRYENAVARLIAEISRVPIGDLLLRNLRRVTHIRPWQDIEHRNASADVLNANSSPWPDYNRGYLANVPNFSCDTRINRNIHHSPPQTGRGGGIEAEVRFTPAQYTSGSRIYGGGGIGNKADEVLFHELFHALRITWGLGDCSPLGGRMRRYDNNSEFYAITVTNVYSSQTGRRLLDSHRSLEQLDDPVTWLAWPQHRRMLERLCRTQPNFTLDIARQGGDFNPFRMFYLQTGGISRDEVRFD